LTYWPDTRNYIVTDILTLTQGEKQVPFGLESGQYVATLTVVYDDGREASQWFDVVVPDDDSAQTMTVKQRDDPPDRDFFFENLRKVSQPRKVKPVKKPKPLAKASTKTSASRRGGG
jgi:hypothetical protein